MPAIPEPSAAAPAPDIREADPSAPGTDPVEPRDLGGLVGKVAADYRQLASSSAPGDPNKAGAYHSACRAALAHLDLLLKVVSSLRVADHAIDGDGPDDAIEEMVARARDFLAGHPEGDA